MSQHQIADSEHGSLPKRQARKRVAGLSVANGPARLDKLTDSDLAGGLYGCIVGIEDSYHANEPTCLALIARGRLLAAELRGRLRAEIILQNCEA